MRGWGIGSGCNSVAAGRRANRRIPCKGCGVCRPIPSTTTSGTHPTPTPIVHSRALHVGTRLLLDARVVDVPMMYHPTFVMLSSLQPLFFNSLQKGVCCTDN